MFYGTVRGGIFGFDQCCNGNLFYFSRRLISEGYILVEQCIIVIAVLLLKTNIDLIIFTVFFEYPCFGSKEGVAQLRTYHTSRNSQLPCFFSIDDQLGSWFVFVNINFQFLYAWNVFCVEKVFHFLGGQDEFFVIPPGNFYIDRIAHRWAIGIFFYRNRHPRIFAAKELLNFTAQVFARQSVPELKFSHGERYFGLMWHFISYPTVNLRVSSSSPDLRHSILDQMVVISIAIFFLIDYRKYIRLNFFGNDVGFINVGSLGIFDIG